ncbi:hypothetical protein Ancab_017034 [Ancistrocladus abbreviatus]
MERRTKDNFEVQQRSRQLELRGRQLELYPRGVKKLRVKDSLYLNLLGYYDLINEKKLHVEKEFCIKDLKGNEDIVSTTSSWSSKSSRHCGDNLVRLTDFSNPKKGFIESDKMLIQVTLNYMFLIDVHDN